MAYAAYFSTVRYPFCRTNQSNIWGAVTSLCALKPHHIDQKVLKEGMSTLTDAVIVVWYAMDRAQKGEHTVEKPFTAIR